VDFAARLFVAALRAVFFPGEAFITSFLRPVQHSSTARTVPAPAGAQRAAARANFRRPAVRAWALLSLFWGPSEQPLGGDVQAALHTLLLFAGCYLLVRFRSEILQPLLFCAATVALIASIYNLYMFARIYEPGMRLIGGGAFDNPLLSSHLFGFFSTYWLSLSMTCKRRQMMWLSIPAMAVMFAAVMATGSRTPLVALTLAALWLCFICWNRRSVGLLGALFITGATVAVMFSQNDQ
jgi:hypothetical protein